MPCRGEDERRHKSLWQFFFFSVGRDPRAILSAPNCIQVPPRGIIMPLYSDSESEFEEEDEESDDEPTPLLDEDEDESDSEDECPRPSARTEEAELIRVSGGFFYLFILSIIYAVSLDFDGLGPIRWLLVAIMFSLVPELIVDGSKVRCLYGLRIRSWLPQRQALCLCARSFLVNAHFGTFHTKRVRDAAVSTFCSAIILLVIIFVNVFFIEIVILRPIRWISSTLADPTFRTAALRELSRLHGVFFRLKQDQNIGLAPKH